MRQQVAIGAVGMAVVLGVAGCSGEKPPSETTSSTSSTTKTTSSSASTTTTTASPTQPPTGNPPAGQAEVTVDGVRQNITGNAVCTNAVGNFNIAIGQKVSGVAVVLTPDGATVHSVILGNVNGVILGYQQGMSGGQATASKDGNTYIISGSATGVTAALPPVMVTKPFEIRVTCS
ncbi:lipoprotein LpqH [Mycolicibacterium mucogenicum]|uniref:lipoprotein LpqH n=1 Tax=Mycolicibacterium mucogenicum TaxID=56689 RepID=UPI002269F6C9|nr:lipoprotein LpqH [Mycolicibacterium mucogenicum]MCX8562048.1 lipoprotein LpqH [Mycolicibacterium mucogenicum]